jgi:hypothetical protein
MALVLALRSSPEAARLTIEVAELLQEKDRLEATIRNLQDSHDKLIEVNAQLDAKTAELLLLAEAARSALQ